MEVLAGTPCSKENCVMDITLRREIEELRGARITQIRARYREVFEEEPRSKHREQLLRRLVWRLQAVAEGGLSEAARQRAYGIADESDLRVLPPRGFVENATPAGPLVGRSRSHLDRRIPLPGAILKREYNGRTITVKVLMDGFEHPGRRYGSLSAIASAVTGTRWNGLAFFGLTRVRGAALKKGRP
jgi:hypothetical protein